MLQSGEGEVDVSGDVKNYDTVPIASSTDIDSADMPALSKGHLFSDTAEQALQKLRDAASHVVASKQRIRRIPRASRLSPVYDISGDIQRNSTPMPSLSVSTDRKSSGISDSWSWFHKTAGATSGQDDCANTDPLQARQSLDTIEAAGLEDDMQHAVEAEVATVSVPHPVKNASRMQLVFTCLSIFAIVLILSDGLLIVTSFWRPQNHLPNGNRVVSGTPSLVLSANTAYYGQHVTLYIRHFSFSGHVSLTRDTGTELQIDTGKSPVTVGVDGSMDVAMHIDTSWSPGSHIIAAEDVKTHYVAHASLQIATGKSIPPQLKLSTTKLDLGVDIQGTNTFRALTLSNDGGASVSWSASSDQPWLLLTPAQGIFSDTQTIGIAGQRSGLSPGDYTGQLTFSSSSGPNQVVVVKMSVRPIPSDANAVLSVTPAIFSYLALDGGANPDAQSLAISNPGSQPLHWSLGYILPSIPSDQKQSAPSGTTADTWLGIDQMSGIVMPGTTSSVHVIVHSVNLLPGTYLSSLVFTTSAGYTALNTQQSVLVSLTIQPHCGLALSAGNMSFTAVAGQNNPSNQVLSFVGTGVCPGTAYWHATSSSPWLVVTPPSGQLENNVNAILTVGVNATDLKPGTYVATIALVTIQTTQSVSVQLVVQQTPPFAAPVIGASPLALNFSATLGQGDPPGQSVTVTNTGGSPLIWHYSVSNQALAWLNVSVANSSIPPGQSAQLLINVNASQLAAGSYVGQVSLNGVDENNIAAAGSPQTIQVNFVVQMPCTLLSPSSRAVAFGVVQASTPGAAEPTMAGQIPSASPPVQQSIAISASGNCAWPVSWKAKVLGNVPWLQLSAFSGSLSNSGQTSKLVASLKNSNLAPGTYQAQVSISAIDASNMPVQSSPQTFTVSLTVQQPCTLQSSIKSFSFSLPQGQTNAAAQQLSFNEVGACSLPISWSATTDSASTSWLSVTPGFGSGSGAGTVQVSANAFSMAPGTYQGSVILAANGSGGATIQGSPLTIPVTLVVTASSPGGGSTHA